MSLEDMMGINVLIPRNELAQHGYYVIGDFGKSTIYANDKMPNLRYLGHFVDDFKKYIRLTDKYRVDIK
jgi:hypothetical protein